VNSTPTTPRVDALEIAVAAHVTAFLLGVSWAFGGNADWVRTPIGLWGSLGIVLTLVIVARRRRSPGMSQTLRWAWPVIALNVIVGASCLTAGCRFIAYGQQTFMMPVKLPLWIPSSAQPALSLRSLWLFDGIYFSCLNVALAVGTRSTLRRILAVLVANALALSVFGTIQKLVGSTGIYFGSITTPHPQFFASFVYDNHWGAFLVIMTAACVGLVLRYAHRSQSGGFFHGPALAGAVAGVLMAITVPLSGSRACTALLGLLAVAATIQGIPRISRALGASGVGPSGAFAAMALAGIVAAAAVWLVAGDVILARTSKTRDQLSVMLTHHGIGSRAVLYHDTWRMARQRVLFGWGMGSYPTIFVIFNSQESKVDHLPVIYHDAHSDWLQSVAEIGLVGTALIGTAVALPASVIWRRKMSPIPYFLLCGCLLVAAYAWIEFPFGNLAVILSWWLCFLVSVHYIRLSAPERCTPP